MSDSLLKDQILFLWRQDPNISRRLISQITGAKYGWVRNVISKHQRAEVTKKRGVRELPFSFHGWFWSGLWDSSLYDKLPGVVVNHRNKMKRWKGRFYILIMHKGGRVLIYPLTDHESSWKKECLEFMKRWMHPKLASALMKSANLKKVGKKSFAVSTPGVPKKIQVTLKGIGSFKTDTTPYPEGTSEVEIDPGLEKRLDRMEQRLDKAMSVLESVLPRFSKSIERFNQIIDGSKYKVPTDEGHFIV